MTPAKLDNGVLVACRKCKQCRENRINDWVGRCVAENRTAAAGHSITLTYGRDEYGFEDHERAKVLTYSDVQKFIKLLRRHGYPCRYFAVGEYGSAKGRAHWHLMIYWTGTGQDGKPKVPPHELTTVRNVPKRFQNRFWVHGFQHWEAANPGSVRYICKYIQKDIGKAERQGHLAMSKKPPLGDAYFRRLAERYVDNGLAPQSLEYTFPEAINSKGEKIRFYMTGVTAHNFLGHFVATWHEKHKGKFIPNSDLVEEWQDKNPGKKAAPVDLKFAPKPRKVYRPSGSQLYAWMKPEDVKIDEGTNCFYVQYPEGTGRLVWVLNEEGEFEWHDGKIGARDSDQAPTYYQAKKGR